MTPKDTITSNDKQTEDPEDRAWTIACNGTVQGLYLAMKAKL